MDIHFSHYKPPTTKIPFIPKKYHVFLSFRGPDVRTTLVDHLFESLSAAGVHVFLDNERLEKGEDIGLSLENAIDNTDIHIPIFSKNYARSVWCLKEATQISKSKGLVIPLFYDVEPSDVRYPEKETSPYAEAFKGHYSRGIFEDDMIADWKNALHDISSRSGWSLQTTFGNGLRELQRQVLKDLLKTDTIEVSSVEHGKSLMGNRLGGIRALIILDDVDRSRQLDALSGDWLAPGSRVIVTTRDQDVLNDGRIKEIHKMAGLKKDQALELFCWHAFLRESPPEGYEESSKTIAEACCGLPLSLEVLGAHLYDKADMKCWLAVANLSEWNGNEEIFKTLKISYDALEDEEKQIFIDIACFFIGEFTEDPILFWESLYKNVNKAINNLSMKSLIKISVINNRERFQMHDHLRDMGRAIVRNECSDNSGICNRLWMPADAGRVIKVEKRFKHSLLPFSFINFKKRMGTQRTVQYLSYYSSPGEDKRVTLPSMPNLRYFCSSHTKIERQSGKFASDHLKWLKLDNCSFVRSPSLWKLENLVILDLQDDVANSVKKFKVYSLSLGDFSCFSRKTVSTNRCLIKLDMIFQHHVSPSTTD